MTTSVNANETWMECEKQFDWQRKYICTSRQLQKYLYDIKSQWQFYIQCTLQEPGRYHPLAESIIISRWVGLREVRLHEFSSSYIWDQFIHLPKLAENLIEPQNLANYTIKIFYINKYGLCRYILGVFKHTTAWTKEG